MSQQNKNKEEDMDAASAPVLVEFQTGAPKTNNASFFGYVL